MSAMTKSDVDMKSDQPMRLERPLPSGRATRPASPDAMSKSERPVRPARPSRPRSERRARVLAPDQVEASRASQNMGLEQDKTPEIEQVPETPEALSGGIVLIAEQIANADQAEPEIEVDADAPAQPSVLAKAKESWSKSEEPDVAFEADDVDVDTPKAKRASVGLSLARFNTPLMGVLAGIAVSGFGLILVSAVIA